MKTKSTKLAKELAKRIKKDFDIKVIPVIHRTYVGYWQKTRGGWLWFMFEIDNATTVGSCWKATDVLRAKRLSLCNYTGHPEIMVEEK